MFENFYFSFFFEDFNDDGVVWIIQIYWQVIVFDYE